MLRILARTAAPAAAAAVMVAAGPGIAQAARVSTRVPCDPAALASDISSAASGATLGLPAGCVYVLTTALPTVSQNLTINGNGATVKRSTAAGTPAFVILTVSGGTLSLHKLSFTNGDGAISVTQSGNLSVNGGTFSRNRAPEGGAIDIDGGISNVTITSATFTGNKAKTAGGAIYNGENAGTTVTKCSFIGNHAASGGALFDFAVYGAKITSSSFTGNTAVDGGAILNDPIGGEVLTQDTISGNSASQDGGGIYSNLTTVAVQNSVITGNQAGGDGGGIYQHSLEWGKVGPDLTGTRVTKNSAANGGGIYSDTSITDLTGSTVSGNTATVDGGGIDNAGSSRLFDNLNLATSKITDNQAGADGGGIYNVGDLAATSVIITYNTAAGGGGIYDGPDTETADTVTLTTSQVQHNKIDNCEPLGSITGCTG